MRMFVAPLVGAWIEISWTAAIPLLSRVAPLVGAWIEISMASAYIGIPSGSLPLWERGLKSVTLVVLFILTESLPLWERGLKSCTPAAFWPGQ